MLPLNLNLSIPSPQKKWVAHAARLGLVANGVVYLLLGGLTFAAAFEPGHSGENGKVDTLEWLGMRTYFGPFFLGLVGIGLLCYAVWRLVEGFLDSERLGNGLQGLAVRAGFLFTGGVYGVLSYFALRAALKIRSGPNGEESQNLLQKIVENTLGQWLVGAVGLGTIAIGLYQLYFAASGKYRKFINETKLEREAKRVLLNTGLVGYGAQGVVWLVVGYLIVHAALTSRAGDAGSLSSAFGFMKATYGSWMLAVVAVGMVSFGIFMLIRARYQPIRTP
ncbi:DUF1206 domain-containing protein [Rhabdobacter roseus]|uniref:Multisubunit Na+/H+ antiporter MnhB subunit n=1 Tax=Rhabdobacter roseus TaxID=1655419 RepID=A0A840TJM4_9BACT|nr:DUF1206 domain-containing protein [Rhabdobacter roseus]MBB5283621.1 multisubunit Na+/H+ antiporter MnhB subunit [Rhabdobacter roseus]